MPVTCPHCSTRYVLPESLIGPGGARVRCPRCREPFSVGPDGSEIVPLPLPAPVAVAEPPPARERPQPEPAQVAPYPASPGAQAPPGAPAPVAVAEPPAARERPEPEPAQVAPVVDAESLPHNVARAVLDDLASHSGEAIAASQAQGHLFREFGAVIAEAYEFYRRRVGPGADPAPFRAALKERWGVDLEPGHPSRRLS